MASVQMDYTCKRLEISPNAFTDAFGEPPLYSIYSTLRPRYGQQRASLRRCQHRLCALFRRLAISSSRPIVGPFTPPLHGLHFHALSLTRAPHPLLTEARAPHPPPFSSPRSRFLCARAPHLPHSLPPSLSPSARHASCAVLTFVFFLNAFHVPPRPPPRPLPGRSLISCSYLEASVCLRCRPPPACGGEPGAVLVWFSDHCFILRSIRQR